MSCHHAGPRRGKQGTSELQQRIIRVMDDEAKLRTEVHITLLAAGFVIGPSGHSIRAVCETSGAAITSRTQQAASNDGPFDDALYRAFVIVGTDGQRAAALDIITAAVDHYQKLFSGATGTLLPMQ
jgi:1,4-dihydroxy-2-naphthoyl-CoA synthase